MIMPRCLLLAAAGALVGSAGAFSPSAMGSAGLSLGPRDAVSRPAIIGMAELDPVKAKIAAAKAAKAAKELL